MKEFSDVTKEDINKQYKLISMNIKRCRIEKNFTQENLAFATFYTNAESFKRDKHFNLEHIIKISKILDVNIEEFFKEN